MQKKPFVGDDMLQCLAQPFDFKNTNLIVVSRAALNPCGHSLLNTGGQSGYYFHIAEIRGKPKFMREQGYRRYIRENGKPQLSRVEIKIQNPEGAHRKLEELLAKPWTWFVLPHNCASFIEDVVRAGGSNFGLYFNCPSIEVFE